MRRKIITIVTLCLLLTIILATMPVKAATEEEIESSIELGLSWLASQQQLDGSWGGWNKIAKTGLAVLKFIDYVKEVPEIDSWTDPEYVYHDVVVDGLDYLFSNGYFVPINLKTYGDPDVLPDGQGIRFNGFDDYETSIALMAIAATMTPTRTVAAPGPLNGLDYSAVVQNIVDYLSYVQRESTYARGGWGYEGYSDWADNSVSGYATLGLGYAEVFGATIPPFVKDELVHWIGLIQSPTGYSYYRPTAVWPDPYGDLLLRTGNLLYQMALVGMPLEDPQVQLALDWVEANWGLAGNSYQRAFCLMKGLEAYGITDEITVGGSGDWFDELSTFIVGTQNLDGSWPTDDHDYDNPYTLTAAWALLTLEKAVAVPVVPVIKVSVDVKPGSWPNPFNKDAKGVFAIAICGTEELDVTTLDPATIKLYFNEVTESYAAPLRWTYEDTATPYPTPNPDEPEGHDLTGDGYMDLVLHFSRQEVTSLTACDEPDMSYWKLILKGNLMEEFEGTPFTGYDWIRIQYAKAKNK